MSDYNELINILKYLLTQRFAPMPYYVRGLLGNGAGQVQVPGRPDHNYARFNRSSSESFEVFNKEVSQPVDGLPILIGEFPWQPGLTQVVGIDWMTYEQTGWGQTYASIQAHASTHEWPDGEPGSDYLDVFMRAIYPLRGYSGGSGSMSLYAAPYEYDYTGTNHYWPGLPPISLQGTQPPTGTMRYMGVYLDPGTNTLKAVTGSSVDWADTAQPPRPAWPRNVFPVAYTRVYGGQAYITERDTYDARRIFNTTLMFTGTSAGSGGSWPFAHTLTVDPTDADADYSTIATALAASTATTDRLLMGTNITEDVTVNKATPIVGINQDVTITPSAAAQTVNITQTGSKMERLTVNAPSSGTPRYAVKSTTSCVLRDIVASLNGTGSTSQYGFHNSGGGTMRLYDCDVIAVGASYGTGLYATGAGAEIELIGGRISAGSLGVAAQGDSGGRVILNGVKIISGTIGAQVKGDYYDVVGNHIYVDTTGVSRGIWLIDVSTDFRKKYATLDDALAAGNTGDTIEFDGTITLTANFDLNKAVTLQGINPETSIINTSTNSLTAITMSAAGAACRNFKVTNSGAGSGGAGIFWTASDVILEDLIISVTGAGTTNYGYGPSGAVTATVKNVNSTVSGGTNNYAAAFVVGNSVTEIIGGKLSGSTYDIYGTVAGASVSLNMPKLAGGGVNFSGTATGAYLSSGDEVTLLGAGNTINIIREQLIAARTYYVRTDGSDSNNGLANTAGGAFLTIQKAVNIASALDNGGFDITIQVGNGTYTGAVTLKSFVGSGKIIIVGDETTPANVLVSTTSASGFTGSSVLGLYSLRGMELRTTTSGHCINVDGGTKLEFQNLRFGAAAIDQVRVQFGATVTVTGNYTIAGNASRHINCAVATMLCLGRTVTVSGTPAFGTAFCVCSNVGNASFSGTTYSGGATGTRYTVATNGVIDTAGGGANFFPGNAAGSAATGGQYI